jgi:uncharacterized membrane protein (UPF0127 family)
VALVMGLSAATAAACPLDLPTTRLRVGAQVLEVELAVTPETRACGLSRRHRLEAGHGMLFVYPRARPLTFWMKDTWIPLSIAFIDDRGLITGIATMAPDRTDLVHQSPGAARLALEVVEGWFADHGIAVGDRVEVILR